MTPALTSLTRPIAHHLGVIPPLVLSDLRTPTVVLARHVVMYIARAELGMTYEEIGLQIERHNSSVHHGIGRIATLIRQGDERVLAAVTVGEAAAAPWRKLSPRDALRERRERLIDRAREMMAEADRIGSDLGARVSAAE